MPDLSLSLRLRALLVATGALSILLPATAASASSVLASMMSAPPPVPEAALAPEQRDVPPARAERPAPESKPKKQATPAPIGQVDGVELLDVSTQTLAIGFHEGATRSVSLTPITDVPKGTPEPVVLPSRGRGTGPTTAVDIAVPADVAITAPVSGEVVEANQYALYGAATDFLITIAPDEAPHLRVRLFHLEEPQVEVGDTVVAGRTVIAERARQLTINSQIDRISGKRTPHVHLQVDAS